MSLSRSSSAATANQPPQANPGYSILVHSYKLEYDDIHVNLLPTVCRVTFVAATSAFVLSAVTGTLPEHQASLGSAPVAVARPRCSSILHLFGPWLFEAAFIGSEFAKRFAANDTGPSSTPSGSRRPNDLGLSQNMTPRPAGTI